MALTLSAQALKSRLGEPGLLVVDTRSAEDWREGSIPGAVHLDVYAYFIPGSDAAGRADLDRAAWQALSSVGATSARTTVYLEAQTGMVSPRGLWFHEHCGLDGGLILDGGFDAWTAADGAVAPGSGLAGVIASVAPGPVAPAPRRDLFAGVDEVLARAPGTALLDVRRRSEFDGSFAHPCCARAGRIPGAIHLFYEDLLQDGQYRPAQDIAARALEAGLTPEQPVIVYCHRGARAATALYGLQLAGFARRASVFVGSWHEWAERSDLAIETGS